MDLEPRRNASLVRRVWRLRWALAGELVRNARAVVLTVALSVGVAVIAGATVDSLLFHSSNHKKRTASAYVMPSMPAQTCTHETTPVTNLQTLIANRGPGDVLCLREGVYDEADDQVSLTTNAAGAAGSPFTLTNYPGEVATIRAQFKLGSSAPYVNVVSQGQVGNLKIDGTYSQFTGNGAGVTGTPPDGCIKNNQGRCNVVGAFFNSASDTNFKGLEIIGGNEFLPNDDLWRTAVCVYYGGAAVANSVFEQNYVHGCGVKYNQQDTTNKTITSGSGVVWNINNTCDPAGSYHPCWPDNHGLYMDQTITGTNSGVVVRDNIVAVNGERGIQLYNDSHGVLVEDNIISANGQGIVIDGADSNLTIQNNVINRSDSGDNLYTGPTSTGTGNVVQDNCFYATNGGSGIESGMSGVTLSNNVTADPQFFDTWRIGNATCKAKYGGTFGQ